MNTKELKTIYAVVVNYSEDLDTSYYDNYEDAKSKFNHELAFQLNNSLEYLKENKHSITLGIIKDSQYSINELQDYDNDLWDEANEWLDKNGYNESIYVDFEKVYTNTDSKWLAYTKDDSKFIVDEMLWSCHDSRIWYTNEQYNSWINEVEETKELFNRYKHHDLMDYINDLSDVQEEVINAYNEVV